MIEEHDSVVLLRPLPEYALEAGDVGTVVHIYPDAAYEVEFVNARGDTIAVVTLEQSDVRPVAEQEILHVRELSSQ